MKRRFTAWVLTLAMCLGLCVTARAEEADAQTVINISTERELRELLLSRESVSNVKIVLEGKDYVISHSLSLERLENVVIEGTVGTRIVCSAPTDTVLNIRGCKGLSLKNIVMGHDELPHEKDCSEGVLQIIDSDVTIDNCVIFGCGLDGISGSGIALDAVDTIIRDCSRSIVYTVSSSHMSFRDCIFSGNGYKDPHMGGFSTIRQEEQTFSFKNCTFVDNMNPHIYVYRQASKMPTYSFDDCIFYNNAWSENDAHAKDNVETRPEIPTSPAKPPAEEELTAPIAPADPTTPSVELPKLPAPTGLTWGEERHAIYPLDGTVYFDEEGSATPGFISWRSEGIMLNEYYSSVKIYNTADTSTPVMIAGTQLGGQNGALTYGGEDEFFLLLNEMESGDYYFTVQNIGDEVTFSDSDEVRSDIWTYTKPEKKLSTPVISWEWPYATWSMPSTENVWGYYYTVYYSETADGEPEMIGGGIPSVEYDKRDISWLAESNGNGYYYFDVYALSKDAMKCQNSNLSQRSPAYHLTNYRGGGNTATSPSTGPQAATPTASTVLVNGKQTAFDAYNIGGANFFKLRDLAYVLSGTEKQFEVGWDGAANCITLTSGAAYTAVGGEMASQGGGEQTANPTTSQILKDGAEASFTAYNINGANYFKLRDIGAAFDFGVDWDGETQTISIDTAKGYTAD